MKQSVLWWGNFDPEYSRNRILRQAFTELGWENQEYRPKKPRFSYAKARFQGLKCSDLVFVPSFCQKDIGAAIQFARHYNVPVLIDPLISLYDTRVFERKTVLQNSSEARRLLAFERRVFSAADAVIVDTEAHGQYFSEALRVNRNKIHVVPVGAEESMFHTGEAKKLVSYPIEVLFYGSFIPLQGVDVIVDAILQYSGPDVRWVLLGGTGSDSRLQAKTILSNYKNVVFEDNIPYASLPSRIHQADILLGVFGGTAKTARVIPNKVYQSLACGRPVISCNGPYPKAMAESNDNGMVWIPPADADALASAVARLAERSDALIGMGLQARQSYEKYFNNDSIRFSLERVLHKIMPVR